MTSISHITATDLYAALERSELGIAHVDLDGRFKDLNPSLCRVLGYPRGDLVGRHFSEITHPGDISENIQDVQNLISGRTPSYRVEKRYIRKDKSVIWVSVLGLLIKKETGVPDSMLVFIEDITDRKQLEDEKHAIKLRYETLFNQLPDSVVLVNTNAEIIGFNDEALRTYEYSAEEMLRLRVTDYSLAYDEDQVQEVIRRVMKTGGHEFISRHRTKTGRILDVKVSLRTVQMVTGEVILQCVFRDITALKQVEHALAQEKANLNGILDNIPHLLWLKDAEGRYITANNPLVASVGKTHLQEIVGETDFDLWPKDLAVKFRADDVEVMTTRKRKTLEEYVLDKGRYIWVETCKTPILGEDGKVLGTVGFARDITERKQVEEALRQSEERLRLATHASLTGIFDHDHLTDTLYWSPELRTIFGCGADDQASLQAYIELIYPEDRERAAAIIRRAHDPANGENVFGFEHRIIRKDGAIRWLIARSQAFFEGEGDARRLVRTLGAVLDVTERLQAVNELSLHTNILQNLSEGVYLIRASDGIILYTNPAFSRMFGYEPGELIGQNVNVLNAPTDQSPKDTADQITRQLNELGFWQGEILNVKKDGSTFWSHATAKTYQHPEFGPVWISMHQDITERKESENKVQFLTQIYAALSHANQALIECQTEEALFNRICEIVVEFGGMKMAWIGEWEDTSNLIKPVASYGSGEEYLDRVVISSRADVPEGSGPTGIAFREKRVVIVQDFASDPCTVYFREEAKPYGWGASATFPILRGGVAYATLSAYHANKYPFTQEIIDLMTELAVNIGHGLNRFDLEAEKQEAATALEESAKRYHEVIESSLDGFVMCDSSGRILDVNAAYLHRSGYTRDELLGKHISDLEAQMDAAEINEEMRKFISAGQAQARLETKHYAKDGSVWPLEVSVVFLPQGDGRFFSFVRDITERKQAEESMRLAASIYESSTEAIMVTDANNHIVDVNPAFTRITGYTLTEIFGKDPKVLQSGRHDSQFYREMWQGIVSEGHWQGEIWDRRKNGELYAKWVNISVIRDPNGGAYRYIAQFSDITEKKHKDELIWTQANYDVLTKLPNRRLFQDRLELEIRKAHRAGSSIALLLIDLDRFKEINDTLGHAKGDVLLMEAGRRIGGCVRETDTVARLGGDEFTVILSEFSDRTQIERIAQHIIQELGKPFSLGESDLGYISATIGITLYPEDAEDIDSLLKHADQAMYRAKAEGRSRFGYFTPFMQQEAQEKRVLTDDLRRALANNELEVYYQPIIELASGRIVKAEALLRWKHPRRGMVGPATFIPLAEESGLILEIGEWVFSQANACVARWRKQFDRIIQVSVNKSPIQFEYPVQKEWSDILASMDLPGNSITVEITEGVLLKESPRVKQRLLEFRNSGIEVSIDDFGTGFSSLSYLKQFDIDYLKIDRSFIKHLTGSESDKALAEAIIVMAHKLDIETIAEGVETEEQRDLLMSFGCDYAQGFLYSPAVPADEFEKMIEK